MPLVVGELFDEAFDLVGTAPGLDLSIAQLSGLVSEFAPQVALQVIHVPVRFRLMHGQSFEGFSSADGCDPARICAGGFQLAAECGGEADRKSTRLNSSHRCIS